MPRYRWIYIAFQAWCLLTSSFRAFLKGACSHHRPLASQWCISSILIVVTRRPRFSAMRFLLRCFFRFTNSTVQQRGAFDKRCLKTVGEVGVEAAQNRIVLLQQSPVHVRLHAALKLNRSPGARKLDHLPYARHVVHVCNSVEWVGFVAAAVCNRTSWASRRRIYNITKQPNLRPNNF